ncbi:serine hydrolase domain-containing protein [uncultured Dokdonia sp.]|uniref:serine hydrolase domain-containing protein n=1 Tax=uncultured Dokdonia sp. TaxID=575653 RepID=UPI002607623F|nr:serine hydrolase domain-containing protein [uncultured Dokdonia sp.]
MKQILVLIICLVTVSSSKQSTSIIETELDKIFTEEFPSTEEPGGSILVKKGDDIIFLKSYGVADLGTKEKITENTIFNTGSISKTFVSNGILILKEKGLLSLEDSLSMYFDDFEHPAIVNKVKIKHMLSHTSGLPDLRDVRGNYDFYLTAKDKENFEPLKKADNLNFQPGERFDYSNPSYNGLALIIEKLANQPWQDFIKENIFEPSGMKDSIITNGSYPESGVAHAYYQDKDGKYEEYDYGETPTFAAAGNGGIWCSVLDLAKYKNAIQKNIFLSQGLTKESRTVYTPENWTDTTKPVVGYSWFTGEQDLFRSKGNFNDLKFVYHTGSQGGFRAFYVEIPEKDILFVGLFNKAPKDMKNITLRAVKVFEENNWLE